MPLVTGTREGQNKLTAPFCPQTHQFQPSKCSVVNSLVSIIILDSGEMALSCQQHLHISSYGIIEESIAVTTGKLHGLLQEQSICKTSFVYISSILFRGTPPTSDRHLCCHRNTKCRPPSIIHCFTEMVANYFWEIRTEGTNALEEKLGACWAFRQQEPWEQSNLEAPSGLTGTELTALMCSCV